MRFHLLVPAIAAILISIQPVALAQSSTTEFQTNLTDSTDSMDIAQDERGAKDRQFASVEIASFELTKQAVNPFESNFQAKLPGLTVSVNLPELQEWSYSQVSNLGEQIATIQAWSHHLAIASQGTLGNVQQRSNDIVSKIGTHLQSLQEWGTGLVSNFKTNLFTLSNDLHRVRQEIEATGDPEEIAEIQKAEAAIVDLSEEVEKIENDLDKGTTSDELAEIQQAEEMTANLSEEIEKIENDLGKGTTSEELVEIQQAEAMTIDLSEELDEIQQVAETTAILSKEVDEMQQVVEAPEIVDTDTVAISETVAETEEDVKVSQ